MLDLVKSQSGHKRNFHYCAIVDLELEEYNDPERLQLLKFRELDGERSIKIVDDPTEIIYTEFLKTRHFHIGLKE